MKQFTLFTSALVFGIAGFYSCSTGSPDDQARTILADTAKRTAVEQQIVGDQTMRREMMARLEAQMTTDTNIPNEVCSMMLHRAKTDTSLATRMCNEVALDTNLSERMSQTLMSRVGYTLEKSTSVPADRTAHIRK